jgi:hypothetical protein
VISCTWSRIAARAAGLTASGRTQSTFTASRSSRTMCSQAASAAARAASPGPCTAPRGCHMIEVPAIGAPPSVPACRKPISS